MLKKYLKSKLHGLIVTQADVNYTGSISLDADLVDAAELKPYEMVIIVNVSNGERLETYVIEGERGSGIVGLNGGAARKGKVGDKLIVFSTALLKPEQDHEVTVAIISDDNKVETLKKEQIKA